MNYLYNFIDDNIALWISGLGTVAQLAIILIARKALDQIKHQKKQNALTQETIAIQELRNFEKVLEKFESLTRLIKSRNKDILPSEPAEMQDFNLSELRSDSFKEIMTKWNTFYKKNDDVYLLAIQCANSLEVIATSIEWGTAKLEVIENVLSFSFCAIVEHNPYVYIRNRNEGFNLYVNTINLYKKLKPKVLTISEQVEKISREVDAVLGK